MQISVRGEQHVRVAPERAELSLTLVEEGTARERVVAEVTAAANRAGREIDDLVRAGVVERYNVQPLSTYAWKKDARSAERVRASVDIGITFSDFEALGRYAAELGGRPGVRLGWVRWTLTDATAERLQDECIAGAVERARRRAEAMARAAGAGPIEIVEIADPGLLSAPEAMVSLDARAPMFALAKGAGKAEEPEAVQIVPEEIEIGAQLQLRFKTV